MYYVATQLNTEWVHGQVKIDELPGGKKTGGNSTFWGDT